MSAIQIQDVYMWFGKLQVLAGINLTVKRGKLVSIVGPSGCGKTTLLRIAAGLEEPSQGLVQVNGIEPRKACRAHQIGVAFQHPALVPSRTAIDNVRLTLEVTGVNNNGLVPREILLDFGLEEEALTKYPHQLSGGMQQRVDLACAMVHQPTALLLDEPFGPLDEITRERMGEWLSSVLETTSQAVLFVTHSVEEAVLLSDRVVVMSLTPARIVGNVVIKLPSPRTRALRTTDLFLGYVKAVRERLDSTMSNKEGKSE